MTTELSSSAMIMKIDTFEVTCSPPAYRLKYQGKEASLDLTLKSLGTPFWFNQGKEEGAQITPSTVVRGMELFGDTEGFLIFGGNEIKVKGPGIHEHVVSEHISWMEFGWQDWIWFVFDEMYGLIFEMQGGGYKDGGIYLRKEKEYLIIKDFDIDRPQWAFSPVLQHHFPVGFNARAHTDKGILCIEGYVVRSQPWRKINKYRPAMTMPASDMEVKWKGLFTFEDGRTINLNNGRGGNEVIATYNFAQSNP